MASEDAPPHDAASEDDEDRQSSVPECEQGGEAPCWAHLLDWLDPDDED